MTEALAQESRSKFKRMPRPDIRKGSLQVVKAFYGTYLFGDKVVSVAIDGPPVMLGYIMKSEVAGETHRLDPCYDPNTDVEALTKEYNFKLIDA